MSSLGKLTRGLSSIFWSLPLVLLASGQPEVFHWFKPYGFAVPTITATILFYGIHQLSYFQPQERIWIRSVEITRLLSLAVTGLSPFLYFSHHVPANPFFLFNVGLFSVFGLVLLLSLNHTLQRLSALLPDEVLRSEAKMFTGFNFGLLTVLLLVLLFHLTSKWFGIRGYWWSMSQLFPLALIFLIVMPLATTMTLVWKTKETILKSVFGGG